MYIRSTIPDMYHRLITLSEKQSLFLFGARNTGKTTLIQRVFDPTHTLMLNLLDYQLETQLSKDPNELYRIVKSLPEKTTHVVIDEIQKIPKLLDVVQRLMLETKKQFIMTGSSARKLKYGGANLLAGRAYVYHLYPLSCFELNDDFNLIDALTWGTLPQIYQCESNQEKQQFLLAYANTYLREEIAAEQIVRQLEPFRRFLEVAAQCNGKIINYSNMARDTGTSDKSIASYYSILEDTLIGFFLEPFHHSFRKRLKSAPKFYFFDTGIVRALTGMTDQPLKEGTFAYGDTFEHYIILECKRLATYFKPNYKFSYITTQNGAEIDLVIERPGKKFLLIEIKSSQTVTEDALKNFIKLSNEIPNAEAICLSNDRYAKEIGHVKVLPWKIGLDEIFEVESNPNESER